MGGDGTRIVPQEPPKIIEGLKSEIINWLGARFGFKSYLEIATPSTGLQFLRIGRAIFTSAERLLYRTPADFEDGAPIAYRCESEDCSHLYSTLQRAGKTYDIVFVDPFHSYDCSLRDMENALRLLSPCGLLVVHDCNPPTEDLVQPEFRPNAAWCGLTFAAFIDLVHRSTDLDFCVVDTDFGVAIIRPQRGLWARIRRWMPREDAQWRKTVLARSRSDWEFFASHRQRLLHLVSLGDLATSEGLFSSTGQASG